MFRPVYFFTVAALLLTTCGYGQQGTRIDALKKNISSAATPPSKLKAILKFCDEWESYSPDTLKKYATLAGSLAAGNDPRSAMMAEYFQSVYFFQVNKIDSGLSTINRLIPRYKAAYPYDEMYVKLYALKSNLLLRTAGMDELMSNNFEWVKLSEDHRDTLGIARAEVGLGNVHSKLKNYNDALRWYHRALASMREPYYKRRLSFIYNNIAIVFYHLKNEDSALYYVRQGIRYSREDQNLTNTANSLFLYGGLLAEYHHLQDAEKNFKEAVELRKQIGDVYYLIADMGQLALFYADNSNPDKGIALCREALALTEKNSLDYNSLNTIYESLAKNYQVAGDYKNYSETLSKQMALKDSLYEKNSAQAMAEIQTKYELQKKENTIIQQKLDITKKNYMFYGLVVLIIFTLITGYTIFSSYRKKQKLRLQLILQQEKLHGAEAVTNAEEAERKRIAADLHDNLGVYAASIASNIDSILLNRAGVDKPDALHELRNNSQSIVSQLNDTIWVLKKDALLLTAISDRIKVFIQRVGTSYPDVRMDVIEKINEDHLLPPSQAFHLFQIVKEGVNNALKHSGCNEIFIAIAGSESWSIGITDDGEGFEKGKTIKGEGNGLANMEKRAGASGWSIEWISNQPKGTTVLIRPTTN